MNESVHSVNAEQENENTDTGIQKKPGGKKKIIAIAAAVLLLAAIVIVCIVMNLHKTTPTSAKPEATAASTGSENVVTGTGVLEADNQFNVTASVMGQIIDAPFEEGALIHAGDLLYKIDQKDILSNIEKAKVGIQKAQLAYDQNADNIAKLTVCSPIGGTVTNLYINTGDMVAANGKIADVVNDDTMVLKVPFIDTTVGGIYVGESTTVTIVGTFYTVTGTVKNIATGHMASSDGSVIKMVEINVPNPGTLKKGDKGSAMIGAVAGGDVGTFDYSDSTTVVAEVAGKVNSLPLIVGDKISAGGVITSLTNDTLTAQQEQNRLGIKDAQLALDALNQQLDKYNITSAIDGIAIKKKLKKGDTLTAQNMGDMATVADLSKIIFKMNVDELDVPKVAAGQSVTVTADSMPDREFTGTVESVGQAGTQVSGVGLYEIKIVIDNPEGLMPGMSVNAKIHV